MFKAIIRRTAPPDKAPAIRELITRLRTRASCQIGYISGETLESTEKPGEYLVISVWDQEKDWKRWMNSEERQALQEQINGLIGPTTITETYTYPHVHSV